MSTDLDTLQGTWNVTALELDGEIVARQALAGAKMVVQENRFTSMGMGATYEGTLELHPAEKAFDLVFTAGPETGNRNLGIYRLAGDEWTICLATQGGERPERFATKSGTGWALETLTREAI